MIENDEKPILITGCSSGIGYAAAKALKARGYQVYTSARREADVARLSADGFTALQLDLDDSASIESALTLILEQTGDGSMRCSTTALMASQERSKI